MIVALAKDHGLRSIFVTQPTLWDEKLSDRARRLLTFGDTDNSEEYISVGAGRVGIEKYNEALMRICENLSVECIDTSSMHGDERFFYDDFHFNEAGAAELARIIADHVVREAGPNSWTRVP